MVLLKRLWILPILTIVVIGLVAAACGSDNEESAATQTPSASPTAAGPAATGTPAATATPAANATEIDVVAAAFAFNKKTIEVTAGQPFTIKLDNQDSATHNLHIYTEKGGDSIAVTDPEAVSPGSTGTLTTTITQPGEYYFQCDFHPTQMNGTLVVK
jgi:plastocyanin